MSSYYRLNIKGWLLAGELGTISFEELGTGVLGRYLNCPNPLMPLPQYWQSFWPLLCARLTLPARFGSGILKDSAQAAVQIKHNTTAEERGLERSLRQDMQTNSPLEFVHEDI